jgi:hypothetical protein
MIITKDALSWYVANRQIRNFCGFDLITEASGDLHKFCGCGFAHTIVEALLPSTSQEFHTVSRILIEPSELLDRHRRKYKLMPMLEALRR